MKRFLLVLFTLLYLGVTSGVVLDYHYCMGKLADVSVWHDETCPTCGEKAQTHSCCSTETEFMKLSTDQETARTQTAAFTPIVIALLLDRIGLSLVYEPEEATPSPVTSNLPPECSNVPLFVHHCTYLI